MTHPEEILINKLRSCGQPLSLNDIVIVFTEHEVEDAKRVAKELIWDLSEKGTIKFDTRWNVVLA